VIDGIGMFSIARIEERKTKNTTFLEKKENDSGSQI
jgi:hypothetical protein